MDIGNILNAKGNAAAAAEARRQQQLAQANTPVSNMSDSEMSPEQGPTSSHPQQQIHPSGQHANSYPSPIHATANMHIIPPNFQADHGHDDTPTMNQAADQDRKPFACSHCEKGFARRSDLARHERIHSGVRPHLCDYPGCGKQFIQRSALTVHARVHTGEKPHICERCSKPFSDSSSLARHRRIHSGQRPYKCPYANCQKTFTRRTTLTRHQNHHTGTIEEAAAETSAKLSTTRPRSARPPDRAYSDTISTASTPSPSQRPMSMSPGQELAPVLGLHRRTSELGYLQPNGSFPPHLRPDFHQQHSPRSSPGLPSPSLTGSFHSLHHRPSLTSHPAGYGPPQPLEPPTNTDHRSTGSATASPHLTPIGWGSPSTHNLPSPTAMDAYPYPDPTFGGGPLYYPGSNLRRPQSTEPDQYETRPRSHHQNHPPPPPAPLSPPHPPIPAPHSQAHHPAHHPAHLTNGLGVGPDWSHVPAMGMQHMHPMN